MHDQRLINFRPYQHWHKWIMSTLVRAWCRLLCWCCPSPLLKSESDALAESTEFAQLWSLLTTRTSSSAWNWVYCRSCESRVGAVVLPAYSANIAWSSLSLMAADSLESNADISSYLPILYSVREVKRSWQRYLVANFSGFL